MILNRPLELGPEPEAAPTPAPVPAATAARAEAGGRRGAGHGLGEGAAELLQANDREGAVARGRRGQGPQREGYPDGRGAGGPRGEPWAVKIGSILDDTSAAGPLPSRTASPTRRPIPWWSLAVTAAAVAVTVMAAAYRAVVSRRPVPRPARGGPGPIPDRHRPGARARPVGAGPRAGPVQSRGRRRRPATLDRPGRARRMTRTKTATASPPLAQARGGRDASRTTRPPNRPRSARRRSCWSAWRDPWPRNCWPSSTGRPSRR